MDKWKDVELEKMKVGGNRKARVFFESQPDYSKSMSLLDKYNSKAAALYRDKVKLIQHNCLPGNTRVGEQFLAHDAMLARVCRHHLSVTLLYCIKTAKRRFTQIIP